jgi:hypothetical protein
MATNDRIGAELPEHEVRLGRDNGRIEPLEHIGDFFTAHAAVQHCNRYFWKMLLELDQEPAGIVRCRRTRARA